MGVAPSLLARGPWAASAVTAGWRERAFEPAESQAAAADTALEELRERGSPTHDGLAARLVGFHASAEALKLELEPARWSLRLGENALESLSALAAVRDSEGRWLAGRRADWVASWPGRWALGAGGAVEVGENPAETLARELEEEWAVTPERLSVEALVRIPSGLVLLVGVAHLGPGARVEMDAEHDRYSWWPSDVADWPSEADEPLRRMASMLSS